MKRTERRKRLLQLLEEQIEIMHKDGWNKLNRIHYEEVVKEIDSPEIKEEYTKIMNEK